MECIAIHQPAFSGYHWSMAADIPGFEPDFPAAMAYHRAVLQSLQHGAPRRTWVLKTPVYLMMLDLLYATYPDAVVVVTHRDPIKTLPSGLSTLGAVHGLLPDRAGGRLTARLCPSSLLELLHTRRGSRVGRIDCECVAIGLERVPPIAPRPVQRREVVVHLHRVRALLQRVEQGRL